MSAEITKIKVMVEGRELELTMDEARSLFFALKGFIAPDPVYIPAPYTPWEPYYPALPGTSAPEYWWDRHLISTVPVTDTIVTYTC